MYNGDVVLIIDDNLQPRNSWKKGVIDEEIVRKDNQPRGVELIAISQTGLRSPCYRPIQKIIPFEIANKCKETVYIEQSIKADNSERIESDKNPTMDEKRPTRRIVIEGQELRRLREKYY